MRICVVCHEASLTGAPRIGFDIAAFFAERHDTTLLVKRNGPLIDFPRYARLREGYRSLETSHLVSDLTYRERVERAMTIMEELRPDVLYVNSVASGEWCEAGARAGALVALHTHEMRDSLPGLLSSVCTPRVLRWADVLIGASRQAIEDIEDLTTTSVYHHLDLGIFLDVETVLERSTAAVPPGVNARGEPLADGDGRARHVVGMCGLAQPRKGADIFFDVATRLPGQDFLWIGPWRPPETEDNGPTLERFERLALPNFYVTGLVDNPYAYLRQLDAFVLTSREDPNPLVVAEALLLGKRAIAFTNTGASAGTLARLGYAVTGSPDAERVVGLLPKVLGDGDGGWRGGLASAARREFDGMEKMRQLEDELERLAAVRGEMTLARPSERGV